MVAPIHLYNSLTRSVEPFKPIKEGAISLYVCGMTVYDHCHVGHARAMVVFDSFVRYFRHRGWDVKFVRNFTDVDDKIIRRANERGEEPIALAERYIQAFHDDAEGLGLIPPDEEPRVSEKIQEIQDMVQTLIDGGHAYVEQGTAWFAVNTFEEYGKLSGQKVEELRSADDASGKRNPADFALWKAAKEGEPSWESPWGPGRPGWHIECSAMSAGALGPNFDIHGGGLDLVFPHHENEIAQSEAAHNCQYANVWMHNGLLTMASGQKMGKSLGNVINVHLALDLFPAETLRLYYLQNHYRSALAWSEEALPEALAMLARLYDAIETAEAMGGEEDPERVVKEMGEDAAQVYALGSSFEERFFETVDHDFNTGKGLGLLFQLARAINRFGNHKKAKKRGGPVVAPALQAFKTVGASLGFLNMTPAAFHEEVKGKRLTAMGSTSEEIEELLAQRVQARADKDWAKADSLRAELETRRIIVMDTADGVQWRIRLTDASDTEAG